jgi:hypothetical protein
MAWGRQSVCIWKLRASSTFIAENFQLLASQLDAIKRQVEGDAQTYNTQFITYLLQVTAKHYVEIAEITYQFLLANLTQDPDPIFLAAKEIQVEGGEGAFNGLSNPSTKGTTELRR